MNIHEFFDTHNQLAFVFYAFTIPVIAWFVAAIMDRVILLTIRRLFRCINITLRGWPPPHLDADGDIIKEIDGKKFTSRKDNEH